MPALKETERLRAVADKHVLRLLIVVSLIMLRKRVSRWAGAVLVALYLVFFVGGYLS